MSGRLVMLVIALGLGGMAAWLANSMLQSQVDKVTAVNTTPVVVATTDIPYAARIQPIHVKVVQWPTESLPQGVFATTEEVVGKVVERTFESGTPLLRQKIKDHLGGSTLSAMITQGRRAMSVPVNDVTGVAGFVLPGNKVDIISSRQDGGSFILLDNVKVLAIDQEASPEKDKPAVVRALTLEVTPEDAEVLAKALQQGALRFTLRNPLDDLPATKRAELSPETPVVAERPAEPHGVTVIRWLGGGGYALDKCNGKEC